MSVIQAQQHQDRDDAVSKINHERAKTMADISGAIKHAAPRLAEEGLRSLGDAMPSLARDGSKALAGGLASLGQGIESLNAPTLALAEALPRIGEAAAKEVGTVLGADMRGLRLQLQKLQTLLEEWTQLGRAGFPYVIAAIVLHGSGGSNLNLITGVAWCGVLWLLCREAWDGRGELASQKRKVEDRAAELEALREAVEVDKTLREEEWKRVHEDKEALSARVRVLEEELETERAEGAEEEEEEEEGGILRGPSSQIAQSIAMTCRCFVVATHCNMALQVQPGGGVGASGNRGPWEAFEVHVRCSTGPDTPGIVVLRSRDQGGFLSCSEGGRVEVEAQPSERSIWTMTPTGAGDGFHLSLAARGLHLQVSDKAEVRVSHKQGPWETFQIVMTSPMTPSSVPLHGVWSPS